jgi:hypothetical protein
METLIGLPLDLPSALLARLLSTDQRALPAQNVQLQANIRCLLRCNNISFGAD